MKNRTLFMLVPALFLFCGCSSIYMSQQNPDRFTNGIYVTPEEKEARYQAMDNERLAQLQKETSASIINEYGDTHNTYYLTDGESYESRLRKFDSPVYVYNIDLDDLWYDSYWYRPAWYWGAGWYNPYWGGIYQSYWFGNPYWYWYGSPSWYWDWYWPTPWMHYHYYGWWADPWWPGYHHGHHHAGRDIYYGSRNSTPMYNNRVYGRNNGGSTYRRNNTAHNSAANSYNGIYSAPNRNTSGSAYRRARTNTGYSTSQGTVNRVEYSSGIRNQNQSQSRTSYTRSRNTSTYTPPATSRSYSGGGYSSGSSGAVRSGGSSYRR